MDVKVTGFRGNIRPFNLNIYSRRNGGNIIKYIRLLGDTREKRINSFFQKYFNHVYIGMSMRFALVAAKYTPPNMGKAIIDEKYYSRPIYKLEDLAKGLVTTARGRRVYATKEDFTALRNGYKFKVVNTKYRLARELKNKAVAYTKGINEAKRIARIEHRGLSKYSWGANINNTMEDIQNQADQGIELKDMRIYTSERLPPIFQRLARKSPAITKFTWGSYRKRIKGNKLNIQGMELTIVNRLAEIEAYGRVAINQGIQAVKKYTNAIWTAVGALGGAEKNTSDNRFSLNQIALTDLRQSLRRMFEDTSNKYQIQEISKIKEDNSVPPGTINLRRVQ